MIRTIKASVEVSVRFCAFKIINPAREEVGILEVSKSTIRMREVMKKGWPEV